LPVAVFRVEFQRALGVQSDYIDYMMGHTVSVYHDIQSKGIEFLRNVYSNSGLCITPKPQPSPIEALRSFARGLGLNPEAAARLLSSSEPHRILAIQQEREEQEITLLSQAIKELITKEMTQKKFRFAQVVVRTHTLFRRRNDETTKRTTERMTIVGG